MTYWQIILGLLVAYFVYKKIIGIKKYAKYPPTCSGFCIPFFGHLIGFGPDPVKFLMDQSKNLGEIWSFQLFGWDCVFMGGNEAQEAFYSAPDAILSARDAYQFTIPAFGKGIIYDAPDAKFQEERKWLASLLSRKQFEDYVPIMEAEVNAYCDEFWNQESGTVNFTEAIGEIIIRTSTHCLQGPEIRAQSENYAQYMDDIDHALSVLAFFYPYLPLPAFKKRNEARKKIGAIVKQIIKNRREAPAKNTTEGEESDLIEMMMGKIYRSQGNIPVSDDEIAGFCVALMLAGQHTSNITSSWFAIHALSDPVILNKLLAEQEKVLGDEESLTAAKIANMTYMADSIKEVLRVRPPIILVWRKVMQDFKYKDYIVPAGSLVCVSPAAYSRMPQPFSVYKNANEFEPERFQEPRLEHKARPQSYIAFSSGRHQCIGEKFAYLQIATIWSVLFKRYNLKLVGGVKDYPVDPKSMLAGPVGPVKITYEKKH